MRKFLHLFLSLVLSTSPAFAQVNSDGTNSSSDYGPNFLVNGDFYRSVLVGTSSRTNVTLTSGTTATTGFNLGLKHMVVAQTADAASSFALDIDFAKLNDGYTKTSKQCTLRFDYFLDEIGTGTWQTHFGTSTSAASSSIITLTPTYSSLVGGDQKAGTVLLPFPCSKLLTDKVWIYKAAGGSRAFNIGKVYVTYEKGPFGYIQPPNTFTATVSATGVVSSLTPTGSNWIANGVITDTSLFSHAITGFNSSPNCTVTPRQTSTDVVTVKLAAVRSSTNVTVRTYVSTTGTKAAFDYDISCTKTGADFSQPAVSVSDVDFKNRTYASTTQGFGTPSVNVCSYSRSGFFVDVDCKITPSAVTAVEARIGLPPNLTVDAGGIPTTYIISEDVTINSGTSSQYKKAVLIAEDGVNYLRIGIAEYALGNGPFTPVNASTINPGANTFSVKFRFKPKEYSAVSAPPVAGLVGVNDLSNSYTMYAGTVTCGSSSVINNPVPRSGGVTIANSTGTDNDRVCQLTFPKPFLSGVTCTGGKVSTGSGSAREVSLQGESTTGFQVRCVSGGGNCQAAGQFQVSFNCVGN